MKIFHVMTLFESCTDNQQITKIGTLDLHCLISGVQCNLVSNFGQIGPSRNLWKLQNYVMLL